MSITYPLVLPSTPQPRQITITASNVVGASASPFTGEQQVYEWPGEFLSLEAQLPPMPRASAEAWVCTLIALRGAVGTFLMGDPSAGTPRGVATGTPKVNGANAAGSKTLATKGWTPGTAGILKAGDYLQVGTGATQRLYKNLTDAASDGSGNVTLDIFPRLREALANDAVITLSNCKGVFRLAKNTRAWSESEAQLYGISFDAIEAI